jgi:predicted dehydrogenase
MSIRVGFVGLSKTGWASTALAPALLQLADQYRLTALSTSSDESASVTAKKYSDQVGHLVKAYHGDTSQIASDPDVDLVVVAVNAALHRETVLPAIEAGKDVFVEWPAGNGLKESIELAEASRRKGIRTMVGLQGRNTPVVKKVRFTTRNSRSLLIIVSRSRKWLRPEK